MTCVGLLKPRGAADGTIQFTPASGPVKHEEDNFAGVGPIYPHSRAWFRDFACCYTVSARCAVLKRR